MPGSGEFVLSRSLLSVPASNPALFPKALASAADIIMLDCEDSVAPAEKPRAREHCIKALTEQPWARHHKRVLVRINGLDTDFAYRDLVTVIEGAGDRLDGIMLPKANRAFDIRFVAELLDQLERAQSLKRQIEIEALIETAEGALALSEIAAASPRLKALHFGAGDFAASCGARMLEIGGLHPDYPGDMWGPVMHQMLLAARANGLRAVDSAYGDFTDTAGFEAAAKRAAALGFDGKWAIHPSQIEPANRIMGPQAEQVTAARELLEALDRAEREEGRAVLNRDGVMIDAANLRMARHLVAKADMIAARETGNPAPPETG